MIMRVVVGAVASALCVSACTGSTPKPPQGTDSPTVTPTAPTPTPTPSPTLDLTVPPVAPEAMATPSADGAAAAATYFTQLYAYAYATADLTAWKAMSEPDCQFCENVINGVTAMVAAGESDTSSAVAVFDSFGTEIDPGVAYSATVRANQGPSERRDKAGNVISRGVGGDVELYFALAWRDGWFVREVDTKLLDSPTP
ncbi:DUF6318 family protein [Cellulomonas fengjieae]|uniref:DUF6318 family protein n=1 Tax=Cellulomonas fengjieae TaxID=2819978 RepID=UPI001AAFC1A4|nr:DUF6318 family protein [Cellulomonas fengjieae]MBO3103701.1 hypothetical protein [Cellulomonas fengjieae]